MRDIAEAKSKCKMSTSLRQSVISIGGEGGVPVDLNGLLIVLVGLVDIPEDDDLGTDTLLLM